MIYNSFNFIIIYPLLFLFYYIIPKKFPKARNMYLLVVSYALYMSWNPLFGLILLGVSVTTFFTALWMSSNKDKKSLLTVGVAFALLPLLTFKYYCFIIDNVNTLLNSIGLSAHLYGLNWAIPIGISFYTFQSIGYVADVYNKKVIPERDFITYALFLSFFPSLLMGPINKASLVIPQIKKLRPYFDYAKAVQGLRMILWGMFMKVVVADRLALYVDMVYPNYMNYTGLTCFLASIFYTLQIYADFGGYSLMAIGVGKTLGFELTENFRRPYFAVSVTDFWHRWHISLSTWLKDYVYIPLGGSRCSKMRNYWNIFMTFLVSGIWHGANWTFIIWGIMHGMFQIVEKMFNQHKCNYGIIGKTIKIFVTFMLVNFAWIFFRMPSLADAVGVIRRIFDVSLPFTIAVNSATTFFFIIMGISLLFFKDLFDEFFPNHLRLFNNKHAIVRWISYCAVLVLIMIAGVFGTEQFIYANF